MVVDCSADSGGAIGGDAGDCGAGGGGDRGAGGGCAGPYIIQMYNVFVKLLLGGSTTNKFLVTKTVTNAVTSIASITTASPTTASNTTTSIPIDRQYRHHHHHNDIK